MAHLTNNEEHRLLLALNECSSFTEVAEAIVQEAKNHSEIAAFYSYSHDSGVYTLRTSTLEPDGSVSIPSTLKSASDLNDILDTAPIAVMMFDGEVQIGALFGWSDTPDTFPTENWRAAEVALKRTAKSILSSLKHKVLREAPKTMTEGILAVSTDGELIYYSPKLQESLGWSEEEVREHGWTNLVYPDPEDRKAAFEALTALMLGSRSAGSIRSMTAKDGSERQMEIYSSVVHDVDFGAPVMVGILRDLTDILDTEKQRKRNLQLTQLGRLAGTVAHDFNNLLCAVMGHSDLLLRGSNEPESIHRRATTMFEAATKGARMTQQLMSFGGTTSMRRASISTSTEVTKTVSLMDPDLSENISVRINLGEKLPPIEADSAQLQHSILNLITNSREAMPAGGEITISTRLVGDTVAISVQDEGSGFSDTALLRLFDPLFTTKAQGHGLGLPSTREMTEEHGGTLTVENIESGGAKVTLFIPISTRPEDVLPELVLGAKGHGEIVWFIDADETITEFSRLGLMMQGLEVSTFSNGDDAIHALDNTAKEEQPNLLVLDINGKPDGTDLYKMLKEKGLDVPVLWTSGFFDELLSLPQISHSDFLQKPFSSRELAARAMNLLAN
jgi:two-component system cell cycle sensor histidine kinase/response regulator CckA